MHIAQKKQLQKVKEILQIILIQQLEKSGLKKHQITKLQNFQLIRKLL